MESLTEFSDGTCDRILCNELWNDLPTKLMVRNAGDIEEEYLRPNLSESLHAKIADWSTFVRAFEAKDLATLKTFPPFLDDLVWKKSIGKSNGKRCPIGRPSQSSLKRSMSR